ncbi:hypothetical protein LCGC14_1662670 [marine sediment metagenome]|uniref:Uncharacterized protein n=1 Tax=marine sediment metagenome TaxID=412755 RepID=A0A0F9IG34_9ZZZZ
MTNFLIQYFLLFEILAMFIFAAMATALVGFICWCFGARIEWWWE